MDNTRTELQDVAENLNEALITLRTLRAADNTLDKRRLSEAITLIETAGMFSNGSQFPGEYDPTALYRGYEPKTD